MVVLDERLSAAAQMIRPGSRVADVGTDHGYLIARLLLDGKAAFGYACDIHPIRWRKRQKRCGSMTCRIVVRFCWGMGCRAFRKNRWMMSSSQEWAGI